MFIHIRAIHHKFFLFERVIDVVLVFSYTDKQPYTMTATNKVTLRIVLNC